MVVEGSDSLAAPICITSELCPFRRAPWGVYWQSINRLVSDLQGYVAERVVAQQLEGVGHDVFFPDLPIRGVRHPG